jgi:hypothetical protein
MDKLWYAGLARVEEMGEGELVFNAPLVRCLLPPGKFLEGFKERAQPANWCLIVPPAHKRARADFLAALRTNFDALRYHGGDYSLLPDCLSTTSDVVNRVFSGKHLFYAFDSCHSASCSCRERSLMVFSPFG